MDNAPQGSERLKEVALLLKQADKLVKEGDLASALELIVKARSFDSRHLYALAYEERVRTLLNAKQAKKEAEPEPTPQPQQTTDGEEIKDKEKEKVKEKEKEPEQQINSPSLQHLSNLAIIEAQHSITVATQQEKANELLKKEEEDRVKHDELRKNAIEQKITAFLNRATGYYKKGEFGRALDEIARAYLLDPVNDKIHELEDKIREAQELSRRKDEEDRQRKLQEEKQKRETILKSHTEKVQKERVEKEKREELDRKKAQELKVQQYLKRINELFLNNKLDEALSELAFVIVIDPLNEEVLKLEHKIIETQERRQQEQLELYQRQLEERQKKRQTILATIRKHVENAELLAKQKKFSDALRTITRATVLDPVNEELQECEKRILAMQEEHLRQEEEKKKQIQDQIRKQQEEELLKVEKANQDRVLNSEKAEVDAKAKADKEKIQRYLDRAQQFLDESQFEVALGEVALAFIINPFDEEVKKMEQHIIDVRGEFNRKQIADLEQSLISEEDEKRNIASQISAHMAEADNYRKKHDYSRAFNEIAKAFILDPLNEEIQQYETSLQEEFDTYLSEQHLQKEREERERQIHINIERATEFLERELFEEALTEISSGLTYDEDNAELLSLRETVQAAYRKWQVKTLEEARNFEVQRHFLKAKELYTLEKHHEAIDELQKALTIDPYRDECLALKNEIETKIRQALSTPKPPESTKDQAAVHLANAERFLAANNIDRAIIEIVSGLLIEPSNKKLIMLEKQARILRAGSPQFDEEQGAGAQLSDEEKERMIRVHLHVAQEYRSKKEFSKALDELAQIHRITPTHEETRKVEEEIRMEYDTFLKQQNQHLKLIYKAG